MRALDAKRDSWKLITSGVLAHDTHGEVVVEEATKGRRNEGPGQRPQAATLAASMIGTVRKRAVR